MEHTNPTHLAIPPQVRMHKACADWKRYHKSNRHVMHTIVDELRKAKATGITKTSVKMLVNWMRWNAQFDSGEKYRINDKYTGIYTHIIAHNFPDLGEIIDTRELRAINKPEVAY